MRSLKVTEPEKWKYHIALDKWNALVDRVNFSLILASTSFALSIILLWLLFEVVQ